MTTDLQALIQHLRGGDWNLRAPQEMADMIADKLEAALAAAPSPSAAEQAGRAALAEAHARGLISGLEIGIEQGASSAPSASPAEAPADDEYETRADGERVRKDRWEWGIRRIVALLWGNRHAFEVDDVVEGVRRLVPQPFNEGDDEGLCRAVLAAHAQPVAPAGQAAARVQGDVPDGYMLVMVPKLQPHDEPDWEECIRQAEVATGLKVERNTLSIVIREVRRWLAGRSAGVQGEDAFLDSPFNACMYREQCKALIRPAPAVERGVAEERERDEPTRWQEKCGSCANLSERQGGKVWCCRAVRNDHGAMAAAFYARRGACGPDARLFAAIPSTAGKE